MRTPASSVTLLALFFILVPTAHADVVHMANGRKIEGRVVSDDGRKLIVETKFGRIELDRAKVVRIEKQRLPEEELEVRVERAGDDVEKLLEAAEYAKQHRLVREWRSILERILEIDPNHPAANEALGRIHYDGRWFTPEELEEYQERIAAQKRAQGYVLYEGKWVKEETAKRLQGLELYEGKWRPWKEIYVLQARARMKPLLGVELDIRESDHFLLFSQLDPDFQQEILDLLEAGFAHFTSVFRPDAIEANIMDFYPIAVYVLPDPTLVEKFVEPGGYMDELYNPPKGVNERYLDATNFAIFFPRPLIVTSIGRHLRGGGTREASLLGFLTHYAGNVFVRRFKRGGKIPGWVESGISHYYEGRLNGYRTLSICEFNGYEDVQKWRSDPQTFKDWYGHIVRPEFRRSLPKLASFADRPIEELDALQLVKAYFLVSFLMEEEPEKFVAYVRDAYREYGEPRRRISEEEAFESAFGGDREALEAAFEQWALRLPPYPPVGH